MRNKKYMIIKGIALFISLISVSKAMIGFMPLPLSVLIDPPSLIFVAVGGCMLAFMKKPRDLNRFLKSLSITSLLCGSIGTVLQIIAYIYCVDDVTSLKYHISVSFISIFYGLILSAISYALRRSGE